MPFKSKAQLRKFAAMERRGEIPKGTFKRWLEETPNVKKLPERASKMAKEKSDNKFLAGAIKRHGWLRRTAKRLGMTVLQAAKHIVASYRQRKGKWTLDDFKAANLYLKVLRKVHQKKKAGK